MMTSSSRNLQAGDVHLSIGSRFENIELVQALVDDSLQRLEFDDDSRYWVGIALREAVANAIKHGNKEDPEKSVEIEIRIQEAHFTVRIQDEGRGFDPNQIGDPLSPENLLKPNGRGIFYMNKFMDGIEYEFGPEGGTIVTLTKRIGASSASEGG
jgi:serine/threonine-protein kinase RsbW